MKSMNKNSAGWNQELAGLVQDFLKEPFAKEHELAHFAIEKIGVLLSEVENPTQMAPAMLQSFENCKNLYGMLLFAMEDDGITTMPEASLQELSEFSYTHHEGNPSEDNEVTQLATPASEDTGAIDMKEASKHLISTEKLSVFVGEEINDVEKWLKDQVSDPAADKEALTPPHPNEATSSTLEVSHGNISLGVPVEAPEKEDLKEEEEKVAEEEEFNLPNLSPDSDRPVIRMVPQSEPEPERLGDMEAMATLGATPEKPKQVTLPAEPVKAHAPTPQKAPVAPKQESMRKTVPPPLTLVAPFGATPERTPDQDANAVSDEAKEFLDVAEYFHDLSKRSSGPISVNQAERLEAQNLCFAVDIESEKKAQAAFSALKDRKHDLIESMVTSRAGRSHLEPALLAGLEKTAKQKRALLYEGQLPLAGIIHSLRFLDLTDSDSITQPALFFTASLLMCFGHDGKLGDRSVKNEINVEGLSSEEILELCFRLLRLQKLRNRALSVTTPWSSGELASIQEDVKTALPLLGRMRINVGNESLEE